MNVSWSRNIFAQLAHYGVRDVVFCAGARNGSLIAVLSRLENFRKHSFFEERSAAFYALGIARRTQRPVAVVTTSGTAVAELLPAVIEAFHTGVPLILISADRPKRLRGTGAPQAIDQTGIFAKFIAREYDLENGEMFDLTGWDLRTPVHLNVCFDEPLLDEPLDESLGQDVTREIDDGTSGFAGRVSSRASNKSGGSAVEQLETFLNSPGSLLVIVGTLETEKERESVARFLDRLRAPVYLESTSGLREWSDEGQATGDSTASSSSTISLRTTTSSVDAGQPRLQSLVLRSGDRVLQWALKRRLFQKVLRIGGVPTVRIWRDLEEPTTPVYTLSISSLPFAGLSRGEMICASMAETLSQARVSEQVLDPGLATLFTKDCEAVGELNRLLESEPNSEPALVRALSRLIPNESLMYVGNSLPIREWDLAADFGRPFAVEANRGVNGIDGQVSTFLGLAREGVENWALIGDLTALYDLPGPWALECRPEIKVRIVVMNNGGGKIFNRIFRNPLFENRHSISFEPWAALWGLQYERWESVPEVAPSGDACILEIIPNDEATQRFWDRYDQIWL